MRQKTHILDGGPPVEVILRRSARARRFTLRVSRSTGTVSLSMPDFASDSEAFAFLETREAWVRKHLQDAPPVSRPEIGGTIPVEGVPRPIMVGSGRSVRFEAGEIRVPPAKDPGPALAAFLKQMARDKLVERADFYAGQLGRTHGRISLRDTKSRWGSCSSKGDLMFSWRLIMAPPAVLDYVAAHEVAHLKEMNHSQAFWDVCGDLCPGYETPRAWLRTNGAELLSWRFDRLP